MPLKDCPINAKLIFKDGNTRHWAGDRYVKDGDCNQMVYNLRAAILKRWDKTKEVQMFDNRKLDKLILHITNGPEGVIVLRNDLREYLGKDYNPPKL
jgi:hypothetical protein